MRRIRFRILFLLLIVLVGLGIAGWRLLGARQAVEYAGPVAPLGDAGPGYVARIHVFETGRLPIPGWAAHIGGRGTLWMDQPAYVIVHPTYGMVMFEAGHHSEISSSPREHLGWIHAVGLMPMAQDPQQDARTQMRAAGLDPDAVRAIVVSHFHPEHVGAVEEFPAAEVIADAREIAYATNRPKYNFVPTEYDEVRFRGLDFSSTPAWGPFPGAIDLVGDGSILVVSTPGHTPGHVSLLVRLPEGPVLLAGDAAWTEHNLRTRSIGLPFVSVDGPGAREVLGRLLRFADEHPEVMIVPGHDLAPLRRAERRDIVLHPWPSVAANSKKEPQSATTSASAAM